MKDNYFKDPLVSFTSETTVPCEYNGSTDLYPRRNRNLINNENSTEAAIKIQRSFRNYQARKQIDELTLEKRSVELEKIVKRDVPNERFWSWFGI